MKFLDLDGVEAMMAAIVTARLKFIVIGRPLSMTGLISDL